MCPEAHLLKEIPLFELLDDREREDLAAGLRWNVSPPTLRFFRSAIPAMLSTSSAPGEVEVFFRNDTGEQITLERR